MLSKSFTMSSFKVLFHNQGQQSNPKATHFTFLSRMSSGVSKIVFTCIDVLF